MGKLPRDGHHGGVRLAVGVDDDAGGIAAEAFGRECVDLEYSQSVALVREFYTHRPRKLHWRYPGVVFLRPEMRGTESSVTPVNPLNLIRLVPA